MEQGNPPHGQAPVYAHDIMHQLATARGTRPRPVGDKAEECEGVPVVVQLLYRDGIITLPVREWALYGRNGGVGVLTFCVTAPPEFGAVSPESQSEAAEEPASPQEEPVSVPWTTLPPGEPPEFAGVNPDVFKSDKSKPAGHAGRERVPNSGAEGGAP